MIRIPRSVRAFFLLVSVLALALSTYETMFNFTLWGSLLVSHPDPDTVVNSYPISSYKVNLVFATKSFVALLFISCFALFSLKASLENEQV